MKKKIRDVRGGTGAGKSVGILLWDIDYGQSHKNKVIDVVSESYPHLEQGVIREFKNVMIDRKYWKDDRWNESKHFYKFETGSTIQFQSYDKLGKAHGPRRDVLHLNECNWLPWDVVDQLITRTRDVVWAEYNPSSEFWMHTEVIGKREDVESLKLTYLDNEALSDSERKEIEGRRNNPRWWRVYGEGELGEAEGRIYTGWQIIDEIPHEARLEGYGLDFGYDPDPAALVAVYYYNGGYILDELLYQREIENPTLAKMFKNLPRGLVIADSAEPKSIKEISSFGINIIGADKGPESVRYGVKTLQAQRISVTQNSVNLIKEYRNFYQATDRKTNLSIIGKYDGVRHALDACFAPETLIYTIKGKIPIKDLVGKEGYLYSIGEQIKRFYNVRPTRKNAKTLKIEFTDGAILEVTPDHRLLREDGLWIRADCFNLYDRIQSGYGTSIQWKNLSFVFWRKVFQQWREKITQGNLGIPQWFNSARFSYSSQGLQYSEQQYRELGFNLQSGTFPNSLPRVFKESASTTKKEGTRGENKTLNQEVAQIKRWAGVAQITRHSDIQKTKTYREKLRSLQYEIYNQTYRHFKVLWHKLQNEGSHKTIKRITGGFAQTTYDLEVEDTHCLVANGVVAHNSRYKICSLIPIQQRKEMLAQMPKWPNLPQVNPV